MSPGRVALLLRPSSTRTGDPLSDGLHELAASSGHSPVITHWLVVSYTTFSPLPTPSISTYKRENQRGKAVVFFCRHILSPISSTFRSEAPYAARTFLSCREAPATDRNSAFWLQKYKKKSKRPNRARRNGRIIKIWQLIRARNLNFVNLLRL